MSYIISPYGQSVDDLNSSTASLAPAHSPEDMPRHGTIAEQQAQFIKVNDYGPHLSTLPHELLDNILKFSEVGFNGTRLDYLKGTPLCEAIYRDKWWRDYMTTTRLDETESIFLGLDDDTYARLAEPEETWIEWCQYRMIIGPPRPRGDREICGYDEDYILNDREEFNRHYAPWMKTWPNDNSWCTVRGVPRWAKMDYTQRRAEFNALRMLSTEIQRRVNDRHKLGEKTRQAPSIADYALMERYRIQSKKITVKQLKEELRFHGLKVSGLKHQLVQRLLDYFLI